MLPMHPFGGPSFQPPQSQQRGQIVPMGQRPPSFADFHMSIFSQMELMMNEMMRGFENDMLSMMPMRNFSRGSGTIVGGPETRLGLRGIPDLLQGFDRFDFPEGQSFGGGYSQVFISSSRMGEDGRMKTESYSSTNMQGTDTDGERIGLSEEMYKNNLGEKRAATQRVIGQHGHKAVTTFLPGRGEETHDHYHGFAEEDRADFDRRWETRFPNLAIQAQNYERGLPQMLPPMPQYPTSQQPRALPPASYHGGQPQAIHPNYNQPHHALPPTYHPQARTVYAPAHTGYMPTTHHYTPTTSTPYYAGGSTQYHPSASAHNSTYTNSQPTTRIYSQQPTQQYSPSSPAQPTNPSTTIPSTQPSPSQPQPATTTTTTTPTPRPSEPKPSAPQQP